MNFMTPRWPAPPNVRAIVTTRVGGSSGGPYTSFNVATHVNDDPKHVLANRQVLLDRIGYPVRWISQVHGCDVLDLEGFEEEGFDDAASEADAVTSMVPGVVCAVQTADCLPLLICDRKGTRVAAVHAGWRGLAGGVISNTIRFFADPNDVLVYLGPAISQTHFQVGEDVLEAFLKSEREKNYAEPVKLAFTQDPGDENKYRADLYRLARSELNRLGIKAIFGGGYCTYSQSNLFYSYRRDGVTGRMASLIWLVG